MRPLRPQLQSRGLERISPKLKAFADLQIKLIVAAMNRMLIDRYKKTPTLPEDKQKILAGVEKISISPGQEQSLRRAEEAILQQIMAAKKGKAYLRAIASLRTHTPILDTPIASDVSADQRRRALALQLLHQFLLMEAVPQSQILPVRVEDPLDNPFLPSHRVEAFTTTLERWASTFSYQAMTRPARFIPPRPAPRVGPAPAKAPAPVQSAPVEAPAVPAEARPPAPTPALAPVVSSAPAPAVTSVALPMVTPMEPLPEPPAKMEVMVEMEALAKRPVEAKKTEVNGKPPVEAKKETSRSRKQ